MCSFNWAWVSALHFEKWTGSYFETPVFISVMSITLIVCGLLIYMAFFFSKSASKRTKWIVRPIAIIVALFLLLFGAVISLFLSMHFMICSPPHYDSVNLHILQNMSVNGTLYHQASFNPPFSVFIGNVSCSNDKCHDLVSISEYGIVSVKEGGEGIIYKCANDPSYWIHGSTDYEEWYSDLKHPANVMPISCIHPQNADCTCPETNVNCSELVGEFETIGSHPNPQCGHTCPSGKCYRNSNAIVNRVITNEYDAFD